MSLKSKGIFRETHAHMEIALAPNPATCRVRLASFPSSYSTTISFSHQLSYDCHKTNKNELSPLQDESLYRALETYEHVANIHPILQEIASPPRIKLLAKS